MGVVGTLPGLNLVVLVEVLQHNTVSRLAEGDGLHGAPLVVLALTYAVVQGAVESLLVTLKVGDGGAAYGIHGDGGRQKLCVD